MITDEQVREYHQQGCVIVPEFFDAREVKALQNEVQRFRDQGLGQDVNPNGAVNYQIIPLHDKSELCRSLLFHDKVVGGVAQLLDGHPVRWLDQIFVKPAQHGSGTEWHQDNAYFKFADHRHGIGMWIAVHDANRANGTLEVIPNSDTLNLEYRRSTGSNHHIACTPPDESGALAVEVKAGGCVFFNYGILHCTRSNNTEHDRAGLALHFANAAAPEVAREHANSSERVVRLSGPDSTGGQREYGVQVTGTWDDEVEKALSYRRVA